MFCAISGQPPEEPVVSKTGHIFERRLIEKHISTEGNCPITKEPLSVEDLVSLKESKIVKPRPTAATSIPGLLAIFQNEWDSLMLETFTLKQHLDTVRQELSHALYQQDASSRVIARLIRERDQARQTLATLKTQYNIKDSDIQHATEAMDVEPSNSAEIAQKPSKEVIADITEIAQQLSKERKNRKISPSLVTAEKISSFNVSSSHNPHKSRPRPGVTSCDVISYEGGEHGVLTGGGDGQVSLLSRHNDGSVNVVNTWQAHSGAVTKVAFQSQRGVVAASDNGALSLWTSSNDSKEFSSQGNIQTHREAVSGLSIHPTTRYFATSSLDSSWALHDFSQARTICQTFNHGDKYGCIEFHPDGLILGTGTGDKVRIWDVKNCSSVAEVSGGRNTTSLSFSENGYYLAVGSDDGNVRLWDLRKLTNLTTLNIGSSVNHVSFDKSGVYLAVASDDVRVFLCKSWDTLLTQHSHKASVQSVKFGQDASFLVSTSLDQSVKFYA